MTEDFAVRPGAADAVLAAARARRFRRAAATGAVALAVAVAAVPLAPQLVGGDGRPDSLVANRTTATPTATAPSEAPPADPIPAAGTPAPAPPSPAPLPGGRGLTSGLQPETGPRTDLDRRVQAEPTSEARPERRPAAAPITRSASTIGTADLCDSGTTDPTRTGWCARYTGPATAKRGEPVVLSFELCRYPQAGDARIDYDSGLEIDAWVAGSGDQPLWRAGQGVSYPPQPHSEIIRAGTCVAWSSAWDTRGQDGFLVVPGDYEFRGGINNDAGLPVAAATLNVTG